jgi:hypothetical protein
MKGRVCISDEKVRLLYFLITFFFLRTIHSAFNKEGEERKSLISEKGGTVKNVESFLEKYGGSIRHHRVLLSGT